MTDRERILTEFCVSMDGEYGAEWIRILSRVLSSDEVEIIYEAIEKLSLSFQRREQRKADALDRCHRAELEGWAP